MQLHIMPYNVNRFTHNAEAKLIFTEASDLNWVAGYTDFKPLYDDACDVGLALFNPRTNSTTYWYFVAEVAEHGGLTHWILQPTIESCREHPGVQCYTMHILND